MPDFNKAVRAAAEARGVTLAQVAATIGKDQRVLHKSLTINNPRLSTITQVAGALNMTVPELLQYGA